MENDLSKLVLKNRSRVEILYDIVSAGRPYSKKTHLMYKGNLSYQQLDLYLNFIMKSGLMEERLVEDEGRLYFITKKGEEFVRLFEDMRSLIKPDVPKQETPELAEATVAPTAIRDSNAKQSAPPTFNY